MTQGHVQYADLTLPGLRLPEYEYGLWLEVGEHVPDVLQQDFVKNISSHVAKGLVLSWARPGQPGVGHVNCLAEDAVLDLFSNYGFEPHPGITETHRAGSTLPCFQSNLLYLNKPGAGERG